MEKLKLMIIDKNMCTTEIEINALEFRSLGINASKVKEHKGKRELNNTISEFIERDKK